MNRTTPSTLLTPSMPGPEAKLQILPRDIHVRWGKLSDADLSAIRDRGELVARVLARYGNTELTLHSDVDVLLGGRWL